MTLSNEIIFKNTMHWRPYPHKNLKMDVDSSFIHNCQNMEGTNMSFSRRQINKLWHIQTMGYFSVPKGNELWNH